MKHNKILIVDDEQRYADMLARRLNLRGLDCEVCYDGQSAIDRYADRPFSLVILDLRLPDLYGTEVLQQMKRCRETTAIVILTGHGTERDREACMQIGAHAFINKPVDIDRLMAIIAQLKENTA